MMKKIIVSTFVFGIFLLAAPKVEAAIFNLVSDSDNIVIGDTFSVDVKIDSEGKSINVGQTTIKFNNQVLEVQKLDRTDSIFSLWLLEPSFSNTKGELSFIGGSASGFNGKSLQALRIVFKAKSSGKASITFTDSAIIESGDQAANVLSTVNDLGLDVQVKKVVIQPTQIVREPELATGLPARPTLSVPLYPVSTSWYNASEDFLASFILPGDVTAIATAVNKDPLFDPETSEGLFNNKTIKALRDGIWYIHVRFQNKIGWGRTAHYRVAIDTVPPKGFEIEVPGGLSSDNPSPKFVFKTSDQLSGIESYTLIIDGQEKARSEKAELNTGPIAPGKHMVQIVARDRAGNATEGKVELEILPIASPEISYVQRDVYAQEGGFAISGNSLPEVSIWIRVKNRLGAIVYETKAASNKEGIWQAVLDFPFKKGRYIVEAQAEDSRGALSLPVTSPEVLVKTKPLFTVGDFGITPSLLLFILILSFGAVIIGHRVKGDGIKEEIISDLDDVESEIDEANELHHREKGGDAELGRMVDKKLEKAKKKLEKIEDNLRRNVK